MNFTSDVFYGKILIPFTRTVSNLCRGNECALARRAVRVQRYASQKHFETLVLSGCWGMGRVGGVGGRGEILFSTALWYME